MHVYGICTLMLTSTPAVPCHTQIEQQPNSMQIVHVTNAALPGPKFSSGPHCLTIKKSGQGVTDFTLCTLNADMHPQHSLDFIIDETVEFRCVEHAALCCLHTHTSGYCSSLHLLSLLSPCPQEPRQGTCAPGR